MVKIVGQTTAKALKQQEQQQVKPEKDGASKFDQKRAQLEKRQSTNTSLPAEMTQITAEQRKILESNLRKRLEQGNAQEVFKADLRQARAKFDGLVQQVTAAPKSPALEAIGNRLKRIEGQFEAAEKLMNSLTGHESPREMLQIQMQMYKMTQNIEIVIKAAEETASGAKNIFQVNV